MREDFAVFVLSHGRANNVKTIETLHKCGYTGKWYIIIDNEDTQSADYYTNFGKEHIIMFDKYKKSLECDKGDLYPKLNAVVYARNSCFEIAKSLHLNYFLELDDDYVEFRQRYQSGDILTSRYVLDMDSVINAYLEFLDTSGALTVAFSQTGDYIGGMSCKVFKEKLTRKAMNAFFCKVDREWQFYGRINEDTTTYVVEGNRGKLFFTTADICLDQMQTQLNSGGLTEMYLDSGTYVKSFFSVMYSPSNVKVSCMGVSSPRYHHFVQWENVCPKIISDKFKKK